MKGIILVISIFLLAGYSVAAQSLKAPKKLETGQLENGLTYYIYPNDNPKGEAVYRLFLKSGSLYETGKQRGLAHFLEHMAFNGTRHFPGNELTSYLESKGAKFGADLNAHTSMNETVYKLQLPSSDPAFVDTTLMILSDWAGGLLLDSTEVEEERGVILSEWLLKVGPKYDAQNAFLLELLNGSRYSERLTIGDTAVINNFPVKDLRDYYQQWYDPSLMAVAVVGDVNPGKTRELIKKYFAPLKSTLKQKPPVYTIPDYDQVEVKEVTHESLDGVELDVIQLLDPPDPVLTEKEYPAYLQRVLLNLLIKARFADLSFSDPAYADAGYSYSRFLNTKGILLGNVKLTPTKIRAGIVEFAEASEQIFRYGFTSSEIEKVRLQYINKMRREAESKEPKTSSSLINEIYSEFYVGNKIVSMQDEYKLAKKYIGSIDSLKLVDNLHQLRQPQHTHYLLTAFDEAKEELPSKPELIHLFDSVRAANILPYTKNIEMPDQLLAKEPVPGSVVRSEPIDGIDAEKLYLSNGATVVFKPSSLSPNQVIFSGFRKGGLYALDSTDFVSGLYADRMVGLSGAGDFSREGLSQFRAGKSASMRFVIEKTRTGMAGSTNTEDMDFMFRLFYLKWTQPRIDSLVFTQMKADAIEAEQTRNETGTTQYYRDLNLLVNGDNYVTRHISDTRLENDLKYERILPIFQSEFQSANGYNFLIIGDCTLKEIQPYIEKYIGGLPGEQVNYSYQYHYDLPVENDTSFIRNVGDNAKSTISLLFQSTGQINDIAHRSLLGDLTSEIVRNQLLKVLREQMGMIYSVGVTMSETKYPSGLYRNNIRFSCQPEDVDTLISETIHQLKVLAQDPESFTTMLADAKLNRVKDWKISKQKNTYWSTSIRKLMFDEENDWTYLQEYDQKVEQVTPAQICSCIRKNFLETPMIKAVLNPKETDDSN